MRQTLCVHRGVPSIAKESAALLIAAAGRLSGLLSELYVAMPSLTACGFVGSLVAAQANRSALDAQRVVTRTGAATRKRDDVSFAAAYIAEKLGLDMAGLEALFAKSKSVFAQVAR